MLLQEQRLSRFERNPVLRETVFFWLTRVPTSFIIGESEFVGLRPALMSSEQTILNRLEVGLSACASLHRMISFGANGSVAVVSVKPANRVSSEHLNYTLRGKTFT